MCFGHVSCIYDNIHKTHFTTSFVAPHQHDDNMINDGSKPVRTLATELAILLGYEPLNSEPRIRNLLTARISGRAAILADLVHFADR